MKQIAFFLIGFIVIMGCKKEAINEYDLDVSFVKAKLVYAPGNTVLVREDIHNSENHDLTTCSEFGGHPKWSNDGEKVLFTRLDQGYVSQPYIINSNGDSDMLFADIAMASIMDWSPDNNWIAYSRIKSYDDRLHFDLFKCQIDSVSNTFIASDAITPVWSPNGSKIIYTDILDNNYENGYKTHLMIYNNVSEEVDTLLAHGSLDLTLKRYTWSPDGSLIALETSEYGDATLYVMNVNSREINLITETPLGRLICWHPDGDHIITGEAVYQVSTGRKGKLSVPIGYGMHDCDLFFY